MTTRPAGARAARRRGARDRRLVRRGWPRSTEASPSEATRGRADVEDESRRSGRSTTEDPVTEVDVPRPLTGAAGLDPGRRRPRRSRPSSTPPPPPPPPPGIPGQEPAPDVTNVVARLVISSGETVDVDRVTVIGRAPETKQYSDDGPAAARDRAERALRDLLDAHRGAPRCRRRPRVRGGHRPRLHQRHRRRPARPGSPGPRSRASPCSCCPVRSSTSATASRSRSPARP